MNQLLLRITLAIRRFRQKRGVVTPLLIILCLSFAGFHLYQNNIKITVDFPTTPAATTITDSDKNTNAITEIINPIAVDESCLNLPSIRPTGLFFSKSNIYNLTSPPGITPSFNIGGVMKNSNYHMGDDAPMFHLIAEHVIANGPGLALDIGANQGFYTFYLATLGYQVHAFEIDENNFNGLLHGLIYNPPAVANRVHLYPMGLSDAIGRFSMAGGLYDGFLQKTNEGSILSVTFDCFANRTELNLDYISFVKLDVEGFETAVLKGAYHSLFRPSTTIGAFLVEVGPSRWSRAGISLEVGIEEMTKLASHFKSSYLLVRVSGGRFVKTCPTDLATGASLSDASPRDIDTNRMYELKDSELEKVLKLMNEKGYDCNFWFKN